MIIAKRIVLLLALSATFAAAAPASADVLPLDAEISIGREAAQIIEEQFPMSSDSLLIARVQRIGRRVAGICGRPDLPFEFHVVDTPDINAFCLPGGFVYVFRGLLQGVPDDDALAFIIAHEIAHAVHRHALRQFEKSQIVRVITAPLTGMIGAFGRDLTNLILQKRFSRGDEAQADREGLIYAVRAGFDSQCGAKAMETLLQLGGRGHFPEFLSDHPDTRRRKRAMEDLGQRLDKVRPVAPAVAPEPLPEPLPVSPPPQAVPTSFFPLTIGSQWVYRLSGKDPGATKATARVVEERPSQPRGLPRVTTDYEGGFTTSAWVTTAASGVFSRPIGERAGDRWQPEWSWENIEGLNAAARETITVPAGTFPCIRLTRVGEDGTPEAEGWLAEGVGMVKAVWSRQGLTQELVSYRVASEKGAAAGQVSAK